MSKSDDWYAGMAVLAFLMICFASWFTHVAVCFVDERWGYLVAGALFFPVAMVHGVGVWLGVW